MESKGLKVILHASAFFAPCLVPILFYIFIEDKQIKRLSIQALLFQFVMWVLVIVSGIFSFLLIGLPFLVVFLIMGVVIPVIGIVKALNDTEWNYPIVGKWY
ncbi:DUF4870 domain-containing protein [Viridibacillus sp. FSL R5-0477]|uniref:DUF4870 domain-containing protein n=1 Tax=Viridibacillus arenosi FSL R5-213 TaxID=1227360 RepID=W4F6W7_9BACL|nr:MULTISPECIES: DUF4870 domain-containing protein [Viridibacillus]ETT88638.1 hypothetical protein C176_01230 [Viridibacillus arenosi FSL R5-213]OMC81188.1 hypothetical protein BK130_15945 [Viridibacillus sp. FSL H8-0123]OMC85059.1 hypothetical protein BK128_15225 [Viridibacillus sp. FSL H7-0596]OMC90250.1 hypothetical protein BK137_13990 [Viridibacillus arenosi]